MLAQNDSWSLSAHSFNSLVACVTHRTRKTIVCSKVVIKHFFIFFQNVAIKISLFVNKNESVHFLTIMALESFNFSAQSRAARVRRAAIRCLTYLPGPCDERLLGIRKVSVAARFFAKWTILALKEIFISTCRSSRVIRLRFNSTTQRQMFLLLYSSHHLSPSEGHKHGVSIQSSVNLGKTLFPITR